MRTRRTYALDLRSAEPDGSYFEGHCAVFDGIDEYGTVMARGCFDRHLAAFRSDGFIGGLNHNWDDPVGKVEKADVDGKGLFVAGRVLDTAHGLDVRKLLAARVCKKLSFGFDVLAKRYLERAEDVAAYWKDAGYTPSEDDVARSRYGALLFTEIRVYEASPVMVPGNQNAEITLVRDGQAAKGRTLDDHALAVRDAVEDFCTRLEGLAGMRRSEGRSVPPERLAPLRHLRDRIDAALAAGQPRASETEVGELRRFLAESETFLVLQGDTRP